MARTVMGIISDVTGRLEESRPSAMFVFMLVLVSYFLVTAGIAFDIIQEPPAVGAVQDPVTGKVKPQAFMPYRINGQYIVEGLCGGFLYTVGGLAFVLLDRSRNKNSDYTFRQLSLGLAFAFITVAYAGCMLFIRIKMPSYLQPNY